MVKMWDCFLNLFLGMTKLLNLKSDSEHKSKWTDLNHELEDSSEMLDFENALFIEIDWTFIKFPCISISDSWKHFTTFILNLLERDRVWNFRSEKIRPNSQQNWEFLSARRALLYLVFFSSSSFSSFPYHFNFQGSSTWYVPVRASRFL